MLLVKVAAGLLALVVGVSCSTFSPKMGREPASAYVDPRYHEFKSLINEALTFRAEALRFAKEKKLDQTSSISLTRQEGDYVRAAGAHYLEIRRKLIQYATSSSKLFEYTSKVYLNPAQGDKVTPDFLDPEQGLYYQAFHIDPLSEAGAQEIFRIQMGLAAALMLMDNYLVAIQPYNNNASLRYVLNYDSEDRRALQGIADSYSRNDQRQQLAAAIQFVDQVMAWRRANAVNTSKEEADLYALSQSSIWYLSVRNGTARSGMADAVANLWDRLTLRGKRGARAVTYGMSMGFGNLVGLVETRKGYLYSMSSLEKEKVIGELQPLDILLEKTPFRLTDKLIPGHYGHVAIWLGTEQQLKNLQVWHQLPKAVQEKVRQGHRVVEALRPGVQLNTLDHFLNIDDLLVLRDRRLDVTDEYRRQAILRALAQVGKEYDFNFDIHTHERIVCSEIAYVVFDDIKWPVEEALRRYTISPDNVAQFAVGDERILEPVMMYYDGKRVYRDLPHSLSLLLKSDDQSYAEFAKFQNL